MITWTEKKNKLNKVISKNLKVFRDWVKNKYFLWQMPQKTAKCYLWEPLKRVFRGSRKKKHGFYLSDIADIFDDPHLVEWNDDCHSSMEEDRYICLGRLQDTVNFFVVFTEEDDNIHLITARKAESKEERYYYANYEKETSRN